MILLKILNCFHVSRDNRLTVSYNTDFWVNGSAYVMSNNY